MSNASGGGDHTEIESMEREADTIEIPITVTIGGKKYNIVDVPEATVRKRQPVGTVAKNYFPLGDRGRAAVTWVGNEKHNPGQELRWAEGKSNDHLDCAGRHLTESEDWDVTVLPDGRVFAVLHAAQLAWRASALAELAARKYSGVVIMELTSAD